MTNEMKAAAMDRAGELPITMLEPENSKMPNDADRYQWLKKRLLCADFSYGEPNEPCCALVFEIEPDMRVSADLDKTIDEAIKATS